MHHNADLGPDRSKMSFIADPMTLFIIVLCISHTAYVYKKSTVIIVGLCNLILNGIVESCRKYRVYC